MLKSHSGLPVFPDVHNRVYVKQLKGCRGSCGSALPSPRSRGTTDQAIQLLLKSYTESENLSGSYSFTELREDVGNILPKWCWWFFIPQVLSFVCGVCVCVYFPTWLVNFIKETTFDFVGFLLFFFNSFISTLIFILFLFWFALGLAWCCSLFFQCLQVEAITVLRTFFLCLNFHLIWKAGRVWVS